MISEAAEVCEDTMSQVGPSVNAAYDPVVSAAGFVTEDDPGHLELLERYGHKLRAPRLPPSGASVCGDPAKGINTGRLSVDSQRRPRPSSMSVFACSGAAAGAEGSLEASFHGADAATTPAVAHPGTRPSVNQAAGSSIGGAQGPAAPLGLPLVVAASGSSVPATHGSPTAASPSKATTAQQTTKKSARGATPESALMPIKRTLRRHQQKLLKTTEVSFYRPAMREQFRRILEMVEAVPDASSGRFQTSYARGSIPLGRTKL